MRYLLMLCHGFCCWKMMEMMGELVRYKQEPIESKRAGRAIWFWCSLALAFSPRPHGGDLVVPDLISTYWLQKWGGECDGYQLWCKLLQSFGK
jgi:hypothetical protein